MNQNILTQIVNFLVSFFSKDDSKATLPAPQEAVPAGVLNWDDPNSKISSHFTVKDALWLPSWQVLHIPSDQEKANILIHAKNMDKVRDFLGVSINVHCWIRPILNSPNSPYHGQDYNAFVKGAKNSSHKYGLATDYDATGMNCDDVRTKLEPKLEEFSLRMEKMPGGNWVHNDSANVPNGGNRYFIP